MSSRFEAEELIRALVSGEIPNKGDILVRGVNGWVLGIGDDLNVTFLLEEASGRLDDRLQLPPNVAYKDEANTFTKRNTFAGQLSAPDFEAWVRFNRR